MVLRSQFGRTRTPPGENESLVACVLRGRSEPIHAVFVEFQGIVNLQGYHLRNQKSCPTAWGHLCLPLCHRPNGWRQESLKTYHDMCQEKPTNGPILTRFGRPQRVRLGSTVSRRSAATRISNLSFVTIRSPWSREQNLEQIWLS